MPEATQTFLDGAHVDAAVFALRPDYRAMLLAVDGLLRAPSDEASDALLRTDLPIDRLLQRSRALRSELGRGEKRGPVERGDLLAERRLEQRRRVEVHGNADIARERRKKILLQIESREVLHALSRARRVGLAEPEELAPERVGAARQLQVGGRAGRKARGEIGWRLERRECPLQLVGRDVARPREDCDPSM